MFSLLTSVPSTHLNESCVIRSCKPIQTCWLPIKPKQNKICEYYFSKLSYVDGDGALLSGWEDEVKHES